jgi:hypothetical protein
MAILISKDKWDKLKEQALTIAALQEMAAADLEKISQKYLGQIQGFLMHVVHMYHTTKPCLIGLHMMIDG